MKVYVAADHAGFALKQKLVASVRELGFEVQDMGPATLNPDDDYPDFIIPVAQAVVADTTAFGIVLGKSGQGEAMAANRVVGARAAVYYGGPLEFVALSRKHNNANMLSLGADFVTEDEAKAATRVFLTTAFSGDERHRRRLAKF
ncbi:ribose-5-phosphate isomerase [Candidatus Kaiserbacteria bacterium RIFCSPLOWO2_02_FULL_56_11]|uniref:Ribose-5-phosphate isomerase n=2 Tax=Candidatus Kaiseribacteriota TaxID=1752734 RepID=A0A1F6E2H0_9BACT|nr:MAG: ribose-5-phosphate isomerase [Candidatus Kaiserbacteria bacterium RIFCSPHIGHO2_02_FULL_56_30]OGG71963.1 MAG: ribose-5-phosphate isomerase [Candidatus Kaiserbacteria bacterium RIFCSPHIGHO2_12_FULL_56_13]OGG82392.1 MAG: ribose-5-phosphate isomerase [Candidatus Kaiserbacteria bacterium RIFCSPLOWO2_02_FULL_56_11]